MCERFIRREVLGLKPRQRVPKVRVYTAVLDDGPARVKVTVRWGDMPHPAGADLDLFVTGKDFRHNFGLLWGFGKLVGLLLELPEVQGGNRGKRIERKRRKRG